MPFIHQKCVRTTNAMILQRMSRVCNREGKWLKTNGRFGWMRTDKVRNHFGVGRVSQAGALAALEDQVQHSHVDRIDLFWGGLTYVSVCAGVFKLSARAHAVRT